ncbi:MAG: hypothetical protein KBA61_02970 [Spirochaetes bacterium]|nr:hypothetical protein [Spirochaetota bacterium]
MERILDKVRNPLVLAVLAGAGVLLGLALGALLSRLYFTAGNPAIHLFTEPGAEYRFIRSRMESPSEENRAVALYALLEYGKADPEFLIERYRAEKSALVKRIIVWSLGFTGGHDDVTAFIRREYPAATAPVKREMVRTITRMGGAGAEDFIRDLTRSR